MTGTTLSYLRIQSMQEIVTWEAPAKIIDSASHRKDSSKLHVDIYCFGMKINQVLSIPDSSNVKLAGS